MIFQVGVFKIKFLSFIFNIIPAAELNALRENFQYIRENNYALFSLFYSARSASLKGGKFEPTGNSETN